MLKTTMLTQARLKEIVHYNKDTGIFTRKKTTSSRAKKGFIVGSIGKVGYLTVRIDGPLYFLHRLVYLYIYGKFPKHHVDHINHDKLDNSFKNLRLVTQKGNSKNMPMRSDNTSGYTGIYFDKRCSKWMGLIKTDDGVKFLGYYEDKEDAINARKKANVKYGYHTNHGKDI